MCKIDTSKPLLQLVGKIEPTKRANGSNLVYLILAIRGCFASTFPRSTSKSNSKKLIFEKFTESTFG